MKRDTHHVNRLAARAILSRPEHERAELFAMLGLLDESGRLLPDDTAIYTLHDLVKGPGAKDPNSDNPRTSAGSNRRPAGMTTPAGLATLTPVSEQPVSKPKKPRERKPSKPPRQAKCGTYGGYSKHRRENTEFCDPCIAAAQEYRRKFMARYRADGREPPRRKPAVCGTTGGWSKHKRAGEQPCRACLDAKNAYYRAKRAERRAAAGVTARPREANAKCGTRGGYNKHIRLHTAICDACREANRAHTEVWRAGREAS